MSYKLIYYSNYETTNESRKYFGNDVYLLNKDDEKLFEQNFTEEERESIYRFSIDLSDKTINLEKLISNKLQSSTDRFFKSNQNYRQSYEEISHSSESEYSVDNNDKLTEDSLSTNDNDESICESNNSSDDEFEYK
jgi:hypothetical protein